ncbi:M24 family metallopeptidase [Phycisphaeraceae bacterium D3-23]
MTHPQADPAASTAVVMAGVPAVNKALYHATRFGVGDPAALLFLPDGNGGFDRLFIVRDIEMDRAKKHARAELVACPADYAPEGGLSGDRETATAQAAAEALVRHGIDTAIADRTLPLIFAQHIGERGVEVFYDEDLGVADRRAKDDEEIAWLREAQQVTERAMGLACRMVGNATAGKGGVLQHDGQPLTAERVRLAIDIFLLEQGYTNPRSIVAGGAAGGDCHELGAGDLYTGQSVIVDIFPQNRTTKYNGDCTRTVVHGDIPDDLLAIHKAVVEAKQAAAAATRAGTTGEAVHAATTKVIEAHGYAMGFPTDDHPFTMPHGTGHGIGLDVHEPPLLDKGGPELVVGDALTIEPGLYKPGYGGVRIEDMVIVTEDGCENLNTLQEGLEWR